MSLGKRVAFLLKSVVGDTIEDVESFLSENTNIFDEKLSKWEQKANHNYFEKEEAFKTKEECFEQENLSDKEESVYPKQLVNDLKLFELEAPSSLEAVKKARNREIKKFHPDKFISHAEKAETAKRILQIYNSAFERLKTYYEKE